MASSACQRIRRRYVAGSNGLGNPPKHSNANVRGRVVKDNDGAVWRSREVVNGKTSPRNPVLNSLGSSASGQEFAQRSHRQPAVGDAQLDAPLDAERITGADQLACCWVSRGCLLQSAQRGASLQGKGRMKTVIGI